MKPSFCKYSKLLLSKYRPNIYGFMETRVDLNSLAWIQQWFGPFWDVYMVPFDGLSGEWSFYEEKILVRSLLHMLIDKYILALFLLVILYLRY